MVYLIEIKFNLIGFYFLISGLFMTFAFINFFENIPKISRIDNSNDFPLMETCFKGIRTSLAFFEIVSMSAMVVPLNLSPFISSITLKETSSLLEPMKLYPVFEFLNFDDQIKNLNDHGFCTLGLFTGFLTVTFFSIIKVKKVFLAFIAKFLILIYILISLFISKLE